MLKGGTNAVQEFDCGISCVANGVVMTVTETDYGSVSVRGVMIFRRGEMGAIWPNGARHFTQIAELSCLSCGTDIADPSCQLFASLELIGVGLDNSETMAVCLKWELVNRLP
jgi:hypothetical protein